MLCVINIFCPHFSFDGKSSIVKVFGQQTKGLSPSWPHCDFFRKCRCSLDIEFEIRLNSGRHSRKEMQFPFQSSGVLHAFSIHIKMFFLLFCTIYIYAQCTIKIRNFSKVYYQFLDQIKEFGRAMH